MQWPDRSGLRERRAGAPTGGPLQRCTRLVRAPRLRRPFFRPCAQGFDEFFIVLPLTLTGARRRRAHVAPTPPQLKGWSARSDFGTKADKEFVHKVIF